MNADSFNRLVNKIRYEGGWFDEFIGLVSSYYAVNPCGGNLHIVLDDGNLRNSDLQWCAGYACGQADELGNDIANLMLTMTMKQRKRVYRNYAKYSGG